MAPAATRSATAAESELFDVVLVGAGISGINAAYRIQERFPNYNYTILEGRGGIGGTWDLFRYPGIRSDSDLHTFGFAWRPWSESQDIAQGDAIRRYIKESAAEYGIDKRIRYHHMVQTAEWSSAENAKQWRVTCDVSGEKKVIRGRFLFFCTGYYNYKDPLPATIPGLENFKGQVIHPQFWPENLDYTGKKISIVGSGATAITLLPILAKKAERVTMVQRSPGYIIALPETSLTNKWSHRLLPDVVAFKLVRFLNLTLPWIFFNFCRTFPNAARFILRRRVKRKIPKDFKLDPHFAPRYNPWEQRLCVCPDADFFRCLRTGKADIVTGTIEDIDSSAIIAKGPKISDPDQPANSTSRVESDIIITATGLRMQMAGGVKITADGKPIDVAEKYLWRGVMVQDMPNAAVTVGYTNASWTLGADATAQHICRLLKMMDSEGIEAVCPRMDKNEASRVQEAPLLNLNSTYVQKGKSTLPKAGTLAPWKARVSYWWDLWEAKSGDLRRGLQIM